MRDRRGQLSGFVLAALIASIVLSVGVAAVITDSGTTFDFNLNEVSNDDTYEPIDNGPTEKNGNEEEQETAVDAVEFLTATS